MKLSLLLFFGLSLQAIAGARAQQVSIHAQGQPLEKVLKEIRKQTEYRFLLNAELLKLSRPVTLQLDNVDIMEALPLIFEGQPFDYYINEKVITLKAKEGKAAQGTKRTLPQQTINGRVVDSLGAGIRGVNITVENTGNGTSSDGDGYFTLEKVNPNAVILFRLLGYATLKMPVAQVNQNFNIRLLEQSIALDELQVDIVNTGFQTIDKERATGSFTKVDNELFNRRVSTNVIERLEGVASSVMFNGNYVGRTNESQFNIRGLSTIFANTQPLIIVDNFPFDGDISNLNPNDVEDITILKDAAASSIWGARSGNGVVVFTTKKGKVNEPLKINFNSNFTYTAKPDIYYGQNFLDASSFIDAEQELFRNGYYNSNINNVRRPTLSPVVELLAQQRDGAISETEAQAQINQLRQYDFRDDLSRYFYQGTGTQQYSLNLSGGTDKATYYVSMGYDDAPSVNVGNSYNRISLNSHSTFRPIKQLEASVGITHIISHTQNNNPGNITTISRSTYYPYARMADDAGNSLALPRDYRLSHMQGLDGAGLLDWLYRPLDELGYADNTGKNIHTRINTSLRYTIIPGLSVEGRYQLERQHISSFNLQNEQTYLTRNLINLNTQVNPDGSFSYGVPRGAILTQNQREMAGQSIRAQVNLDRRFGELHEVTAVAGIDGKEVVTDVNNWRSYGFRENIGTSTPVNYEMLYPKYGNLAAAGRIPFVDRYNKLTDIFFSYFANAAYTYKDRYTLSGSARIDQSNLFGVNTNQKSVPLWSLGGAWILSRENFLQADWVELLKLRSTFGYNGNIDKTVSAYAIGAFLSSMPLTGAPGVWLQSPPNPELRWERIAMWNIGTDFSLFKGILTGSLEYYHRRGTDMMGYAALDPTTGMNQFKGNVANIVGQGLDADITLQAGRSIKWTGNLLFSMATDKVTSYDRTVTLSQYMQAADGALGATSSFTPIVDQPIFGVYSYPWGGLDPENGNPLVRAGAELNTNYAALFSSEDFSQLVYHGYARPPYFGAIRNSLAYKGVSLSVNLTYKFGYYFRRPSINYTSLAAQWLGHPDYNVRWQSPGDESITDIPSFTYPLNANRNNFFANSEVLVEKGDHIRLQDIRLGYDVPLSKASRVKGLHLYAYVNNVGILWKATDTSIDPDFITNRFVTPTTYALGIQCGF